jgi:alkylhydroperoxidase family enzyme
MAVRLAAAGEAQIKAAQGSDYMRSPDLDDRQKAAIRWAEAVTLLRAREDDAAFAAMKQPVSEKQIVERTVFCGMWNYSNRLWVVPQFEFRGNLTDKSGE